MRRWITPVTLLCALLLLGAIALGLFDPLPTGDPSWTGVPVAASLARSSEILWQQTPVPAGGRHLRLPVVPEEGDPDLGAGLVLGTRQAWLGVAISPLGYVRVWEDTPEGVVEHLPWQPWPHVRREGARNEIDVTIRAREVDVFVNREWLWEGEAPASVESVGFWGQTYGRAATVRFGPARLYEIGEP